MRLTHVVNEYFVVSRTWQIENLAETNFDETFGRAKQILSIQCVRTLLRSWSKSLRLALLRLPEVKLSRKNELLRMLVIPSQWKVLAWSGVRGFISFLSPLYTILWAILTVEIHLASLRIVYREYLSRLLFLIEWICFYFFCRVYRRIEAVSTWRTQRKAGEMRKYKV